MCVCVSVGVRVRGPGVNSEYHDWAHWGSMEEYYYVMTSLDSCLFGLNDKKLFIVFIHRVFQFWKMILVKIKAYYFEFMIFILEISHHKYTNVV